jgi:hypothetical protein
MIPESPKYLLGKGKRREANEVLEFIARFNGVKESEFIKDLESVESNKTDVEQTKGKLKDLI